MIQREGSVRQYGYMKLPGDSDHFESDIYWIDDQPKKRSRWCIVCASATLVLMTILLLLFIGGGIAMFFFFPRKPEAEVSPLDIHDGFLYPQLHFNTTFHVVVNNPNYSDITLESLTVDVLLHSNQGLVKHVSEENFRFPKRSKTKQEFGFYLDESEMGPGVADEIRKKSEAGSPIYLDYKGKAEMSYFSVHFGIDVSMNNRSVTF